MNVSVFKDALLKKRAELEETAGFKPLTDSMERVRRARVAGPRG